MRIYSMLLTGVLLITSAAIPHMTHAVGIEGSVGYMRHAPSGDVAYKPLSSIDTLDIEKDLGYDEEDEFFARIKIDMPLLVPDVYLFATPLTFEEAGSKTANFTFGDITFDVTAPFDSKVKINMYDVCLYYSLPFIDTATLGRINAELGLNARIIDFDAEVSGRDAVTGLTASESVQETVPVPMVYAAILFNPVDILSMEAEARGVAYSANHYVDIIGRVKISPMDPIFVAAGYRYNDLKIDYDDIEASIKLSGPFIEAGVAF